MKIAHLALLTAFGTLAATVSYAQSAPAPSSQNQGTTSGPASGSNVQPSTVTQKKSRHISKAGASADAAGDPGTAAKQGSESGESPKAPHS